MLQERNQVLNDRISQLEHEMKSLKTEKSASKKSMLREFGSSLKASLPFMGGSFTSVASETSKQGQIVEQRQSPVVTKKQMTEEIVSNQSVSVTQVLPFSNKVDEALEADSTSINSNLAEN